jgi:succinoglycan biosynthesis transport protein ExoP
MSNDPGVSMSVEVQTQPQTPQRGEGRMHNFVASEQQLTLMEVWRVLLKQRFVILTVTILSVVGALWYAFRTPSLYESVARIEILSQETPNLGLEQIIAQAGGGPGNGDMALQSEVRILQSDTVLFDTARSLNLLDRLRSASAAAARKKGLTIPAATAEIVPSERRAMIGFIRGGLKVTQLGGTDIVEIRYRNEDPRLTQAVLNSLVETYSDEDLRSKYERTMHVSDWLQNQLGGLKAEASDAQRQLADYERSHNIVGTDANSNLTVQTLEQFSSILNQAEADRIMKDARMRDFDSLEPNLASLMGDNPTLAALRSQLDSLQAQRDEMSVKYGPKHPKMIELQAQINMVQSQIGDEVTLARRQIHDEYQASLGQEQAIRKRLVAQEEAAYELNEGVAQYAILRNQAELARDLYDTLQLRLKEATFTAGLSAANITVVDAAQLPYLPVEPRKRLSITMGLLGGLLGGCVLAFLIESIDDRLQTSEEVESVGMLPALAAIPHLFSEARKRKSGARKSVDPTGLRLSHKLVALQDPKSNAAEAYRNLRSSLLLSSIDNPPRIMVVTSALPGEGKTITAINCAIVLAQRKERVLLVDADLRRGALGTTFGISAQGVGLSSLLANPDASVAIPAPLPELPNLHVLPTGPRPPNPAEMLASTRMEEQLRRWSQEYDRIVIDSAPLLAVSDTQALAVFADTVMLVARAGATRKRALIRTRDLLKRINAPIAGVVVNDVDVGMENFYTYRYGAYSYGYGYGGRYGSPYSDRAYGYEKEDEGAE